MSSLQFTNYLCFAILMLGALCQIYDIAYMLHYLYNISQVAANTDYADSKQDNLRHVGTIGLFVVGLTLNIFGMFYLDASVSYGVSFWVFVAGVICFIALIIYEQFSVYKLKQQKMILDLIQA